MLALMYATSIDHSVFMRFIGALHWLLTSGLNSQPYLNPRPSINSPGNPVWARMLPHRPWRHRNGLSFDLGEKMSGVEYLDIVLLQENFGNSFFLSFWVALTVNFEPATRSVL